MDQVPAFYRNDPNRGRGHCIAFDGEAHRLVCGDDRCGGALVTLCGLRYGFDFDEDEIPEEDR